MELHIFVNWERENLFLARQVSWPFLVKIMILDLSGFIDRLHLLQKSLT